MVIATPVIACLKVFALFFNEKFHFMDKILEVEEENKNTKKLNKSGN